jgi:hypothetical protein
VEVMTECEIYDHYWESVGKEQELILVRKNKHFDKLNVYLRNNINSVCILEDNIPGKYRYSKRWDVHFPDKKIAIEYKTMTAKSVCVNRNNRIEEALGSSVDLKSKDPEYKLGYLMLYAFSHDAQKTSYVWRDRMIEALSQLHKDGHYDFMCIIQTNGIGNHEILGEYGLDSFVQQINDAKGGHYSSLDNFFK